MSAVSVYLKDSKDQNQRQVAMNMKYFESSEKSILKSDLKIEVVQTK